MHRFAYVAVATVLALVGAAPAVAGPVPHTVSPVAAELPAGAARADHRAELLAGTATDHHAELSAGTATDRHAELSAGTATDHRAELSAGTATDHHAELSAGGTATDHHAGPSAGTDLLSVRGAGPFRIGARLDRLTAAGLIDWSVSPCDGIVHAGVVGEWAGVIIVTFRSGRLVEVSTATAPPRSPAGGGVGMSFAALETIYGPRGALISNDAGTASAYLVRFGSRVELFTGHPIRPGVGAFQVGLASFVERNFRQGGPC